MKWIFGLLTVVLIASLAISSAGCAAEKEYSFAKLQRNVREFWKSTNPPLKTVAFKYEYGEPSKQPLMRVDAWGGFDDRRDSVGLFPDRLRLCIHPGKEYLQTGIMEDGELLVFNGDKAWSISTDGKVETIRGGDSALWDFLSGTFKLRMDYKPFEQLGTDFPDEKASGGKPAGHAEIAGIECSIYDFSLLKPFDTRDFPIEKLDSELMCATYRLFIDSKNDLIVKLQLLNKTGRVIVEQYGEQVAEVRPGLKAPLRLAIRHLIKEKEGTPPDQALEYQLIGGRIVPKEYRQVFPAGTACLKFSDWRLNPKLPDSMFNPPTKEK